MIEISIITAALAIGLTISFYFNSIKNTWILVPVDIINPMPKENELAHFRFTQLSMVKDYTTYRPKLLMALILFVLAAFLIQIFIHGHWQRFIETTCIVIVVALFITQSNTFVAMLIWFSGCLWLGGWFGWSYFTIGLLLGFVPAAGSSLILFRNYAGMVKTNELELEHNRTKEGSQISKLGKIYRYGYRVFLAGMPIMVGYEVYQLWLPSTSPSTSSYAFTIFSLGIGLNIALFTIPMFREMLEKASLNEAAGFSEYVEAFYRSENKERKAIEKIDVSPVAKKLTSQKRINEHFDSNGKWLSFQQAQTFTIYVVTLYLLAKTFLQMLGKSVEMNLVSDFKIFSYISLNESVLLLSGFCWITSAIFLFGLLGYWANRLNKNEEEIANTNTEILWKISDNSQMELYCYPKKSMPALEIIEKETTS
ncbi:hypothetical protein [Candidatus Uabimicrobium sp. HlEnr_7]|uniref:hypothetical protein n=1 Tax=Candidatus Uabimicrobium helgolandensis TaxID=3095367 RepID=UPI0035574F36